MSNHFAAHSPQLLLHVVSSNFHVGKSENVSCYLHARKFNFTFSIVTSVLFFRQVLVALLAFIDLWRRVAIRDCATDLTCKAIYDVGFGKSAITVVEFNAIHSPLWCCLHANVYTVLHCTSLRATKCWVAVREFSTSLPGPYRLLHLVVQWYYRHQSQWTQFGR